MNTIVFLPVAVAAAVGLTGCGATPAGPTPEPSICARVTDLVRTENRDCDTAGVGVATLSDGTQVRILSADVECLDPDDYTAVGEVADDDYIEGCGGEDEQSKRRRSSGVVVVAPPVTTTTVTPTPFPQGSAPTTTRSTARATTKATTTKATTTKRTTTRPRS